MTQKTLGIIGKGGVVSHFFENLEKYTSGDGSNSCKVDDFFSEVKQIIFLNQRYDNDGAFLNQDLRNEDEKKKGDKEKTIQMFLDSLQQNYSFSYTVENSFKTFFELSDVIIEASGGWASPQEKDYSLMRYAWSLWENKDEKIELRKDQDYKIYLSRQQKNGKLVTQNDEFEEKFLKKWDNSLNVLQTVSDMHKAGFKYGERSFLALPFAVPMMVERAQEMSEWRYISPLPTYIVVTNEPCMISSLVSSVCPLMTSYLVALTGVDTVRLEEILNTNYVGLKKKAGLENVFLQLSLRGFHDTESMIPWIYPQEGERSYFDALVHNADFEELYLRLKKEVQDYHGHAKKKGEDPNRGVDRALLSTIVNASRSRGKALSVFPEKEERALCNGYYHPDVFDTGKGMFFVGQQRFRNGRVIADAEC